MRFFGLVILFLFSNLSYAQFDKWFHFYLHPHLVSSAGSSILKHKDNTLASSFTSTVIESNANLSLGLRIGHFSIDGGIGQGFQAFNITDKLADRRPGYTNANFRVYNFFRRYGLGVNIALPLGGDNHFLVPRFSIGYNEYNTDDFSATKSGSAANTDLIFANLYTKTLVYYPELSYEYLFDNEALSLYAGINYKIEQPMSDPVKVSEPNAISQALYNTYDNNGNSLSSTNLSVIDRYVGVTLGLKYIFVDFNLLAEKPIIQQEEKKKEVVDDKTKEICFSDRSISIDRKVFVKNRSVKLKFYDNSEEDGDVTSVCYNNKLIVKEYKLKRSGQFRTIYLDNEYGNILLSFAHNNGSKFINTLSLEINDGSSIQVVQLNSDMNKCAAIEFVLK